MSPNDIDSPESPKIQELCDRLTAAAGDLETATDWPGKQLALCGEYGVFKWFVSKDLGGFGWSAEQVVEGYLKLAASCLTTTFVITQRTGACRRIASSENDWPQQKWLPDLLAGAKFATVGISHLTTSRQHLGQPALLATATDQGFLLDGYSPWVTGAQAADVFVVGASTSDGNQILAAVPAGLDGIQCQSPAELVGLSASQTGAVQFKQVEIQRDWILDGPREDVMKRGKGANTGGLETSTLAIGLSQAALQFIQQQQAKREELVQPSEHLEAELATLRSDLLAAARGEAGCDPQKIRTRANSLVLRMTQAALSSAKGAGYLKSHDVGRWCRESLFFLVWSCPTSVQSANLCELARIE